MVQKREYEINKFIYEPVSSNMYMVIDGFEALMIDPNVSEKAFFLLEHKEIKHITILLTHEHFDHTSGVTWYQEKYESKLICQEICAKTISIPRNNRPLLVAKVLADRDLLNGHERAKKFLSNIKPYAIFADIVFKKEMLHEWHGHILHLIHTPGHSPGSCCISFDDGNMFTGDSLIMDSPVITRFPGGSKNDYERITQPYLNGIDGEVWIFPGHGETFKKKIIKTSVDN